MAIANREAAIAAREAQADELQAIVDVVRLGEPHSIALAQVLARVGDLVSLTDDGTLTTVRAETQAAERRDRRFTVLLAAVTMLLSAVVGYAAAE